MGRVSWESVLEDISSRIRSALEEGRNNEVAYHVGRPGHEGYMDRILQAWGVDGHNSHTNICSAGARFGYAIWDGVDRTSPDFANADFILLISATWNRVIILIPMPRESSKERTTGPKSP